MTTQTPMQTDNEAIMLAAKEEYPDTEIGRGYMQAFALGYIKSQFINQQRTLEILAGIKNKIMAQAHIAINHSDNIEAYNALVIAMNIVDRATPTQDKP